MDQDFQNQGLFFEKKSFKYFALIHY